MHHGVSLICLLLQAFFAEIYAEAKRARPGPGHRAMMDIAKVGKLLRQYSMNIDGLSEQVGLDTWHVTNNPSGEKAVCDHPCRLHGVSLAASPQHCIRVCSREQDMWHPPADWIMLFRTVGLNVGHDFDAPS